VSAGPDASVAVELAHAFVLFTGRADGDLGRTGGEGASAAVLARRAALVERHGLRAISVPRQVHGTSVLVVEPVEGYRVEAATGDGVLTREPGVGVGVHVADCLPIALSGAGGVAMLHCGWRGLAGGVIAEGVTALRALGVDGELEAAIGPGAGGCCYVTGPEVHAQFAGYNASHGGLLDLAAIAEAQLRAAGVGKLTNVAVCTLCASPGRYFSHRRDGSATGRQAGIAWLR
jgi:YfiH family protein